MQHSPRSARPAAALALAVGLALVVPGTALAGTTEPTGTTTTTATTTPDPTTTTSAPDPTTTTSAPDPTTTEPGSPTTTTAASTTSSTTAATTASAPTSSRVGAPAEASGGKRVPFGPGRGLRAALVPGDSSDQAAYAGGFIVRTLAARDDYYTYPGSTYFDGGNTIDAVLGLDGAGVGLDQADRTVDYLVAHVNDYVGYPTAGDPSSPETYAGPLGKLVLGLVAHGVDPTAVAGQDLVARLEGLVTPEGRFSDQSAYGDYSNTIGQALDVIALGRATGSVPDEAATYLLAQQCADGGFRGNLDAAGTPCTSDLDATAFAAQALVGLGEDAAATDALDFLASRQAANGGFLNQDGQYNANTAGVAAQAFAAGGFDAELASAQAFLASLQMDCSFATALRGGIAFTAADLATLRDTPTDTDAIDRALRATPQATLGLAGGSLLDVTADGSVEGAPTLACATTSTSTTSTTSSTSAAAPADPPAASATPDALAYTGADVAATVLLGLALLVAGVGATVLARRKGAHA